MLYLSCYEQESINQSHKSPAFTRQLYYGQIYPSEITRVQCLHSEISIYHHGDIYPYIIRVGYKPFSAHTQVGIVNKVQCIMDWLMAMVICNKNRNLSPHLTICFWQSMHNNSFAPQVFQRYGANVTPGVGECWKVEDHVLSVRRMSIILQCITLSTWVTTSSIESKQSWYRSLFVLDVVFFSYWSIPCSLFLLNVWALKRSFVMSAMFLWEFWCHINSGMELSTWNFPTQLSSSDSSSASSSQVSHWFTCNVTNIPQISSHGNSQLTPQPSALLHRAFQCGLTWKRDFPLPGYSSFTSSFHLRKMSSSTISESYRYMNRRSNMPAGTQTTLSNGEWRLEWRSRTVAKSDSTFREAMSVTEDLQGVDSSHLQNWFFIQESLQYCLQDTQVEINI